MCNKTTKNIEELFNYYDYNKKKIDNFDDSTDKNDFLSIYLSSLLTFEDNGIWINKMAYIDRIFCNEQNDDSSKIETKIVVGKAGKSERDSNSKVEIGLHQPTSLPLQT